MTRDQILDFGRSGDCWGYLRIAAQALRIAPGDDAIRFLLAANLARLGLGTLAGEQIARLAPEVRALGEVGALGVSVERLSDDRVSPGELERMCRANLVALGGRGDGLGEAFEAWKERLETTGVFRSSDGNYVRRRMGGDEPHEWWPLIDHASEVERYCDRHLSAVCASRNPIYLEGLDPSTLLARLHSATAVDALGFSPAITVVQADPLEALDGLALADLTGVLGDARVRVLVGPGSTARVEAWGQERLGTALVGAALTVVGTRSRCEPTIERAVESLGAAQVAEMVRLEGVLRDRHGARGREYWARRWSGDALRVLIPTCRYSSYIQHASRDLALAFEGMGCEAEVLIEPDEHSRLSVVAYLEAIERIDPDLIVLINYTRLGSANGKLPGDIPFVTWIQDAMPHLYDRAVGEAMGESDFVVGPIEGSIIKEYAYPADRCLAMPVVVSEQKFHGGTVDRERRERYECEIACVTHQSETPEAMHLRLKVENGADANASACLDDLFAQIRELVHNAHRLDLVYELRELVHSRVAGDVERARGIIRGYAMPLADRFYRHEALEWAGEIARERGWRFHLYGKGWERHPTLGEFARGPIEHGEDLRALYQSAGANLHICSTSILHQRVSECFLSGGLAVCRVMPDHLSVAWTRAQVAMVRAGCEFDARSVGVVREGLRVVDPCREFAIADSAQTLRITSLYQSLGLRCPRVVLMNEKRLDRLGGLLMPPWRDPLGVLPLLGEHGFSDRDGLESVLVRAVENPAWRENVVVPTAECVRENLTLGAMIDKVFAMVRGSLGVDAGVDCFESASAA